MKKATKRVFWLMFILNAIAVAFLSAALATNYWIVAYPIRQVDQKTEDGARNATDGDLGTKFKGYVHFGLFTGYKSLDHGLGVREGAIWTECVIKKNLCSWESPSQTGSSQVKVMKQISKYENQRQANTSANNTAEVAEHGLFNCGLWLSTIVFAALGIAWGLVSMGFAAVNASVKPIETITGTLGLYAWNSIAALCCILCTILYGVLYVLDLKKNVLTEEDRVHYRWTSDDRAHLHYSFYFTIVAGALCLINLLLVAVSGAPCRPVRYGADLRQKELDGVMMY